MSRPLLLLVIGLLALGLGWAAFFWEPATERPDSAQPMQLAEAPQGGDFVLQSWQGPVALGDLRGKVVALYFGYTHCPDVCPVGLSYLSGALKQLGAEEVGQVQALFISVDPARDTPEYLKDYVEYFHPAVLGVTGSDEALTRVANLYGAAYYRVEPEGSAVDYAVDHSANIYLIDKQGVLRQTLAHGASSNDILKGLRELIASPVPAT
jgi:protein SCO1/2